MTISPAFNVLTATMPPAPVVNPVAVSNCKANGLFAASRTVVVMRILYVVDALNAAAGVNVATVSPPLNAGAAVFIAMQLLKLSGDTWILPVQAPAEVCAVTVPVLIASLKVTATVVPVLTLVAPLAGVVLLIVGGVTSEAAVVKPAAVSNCVASALPATSCTAVVTRIL